MANKKITQLTPLGATPDAADIVPIVDDPGGVTPVTKSVTVANLMGSAPVQSVATRTGAVTLAHGDISGLGTAATTAATDYATSAQGGKADTATQPSDNISTLTNDSSFIAAAGAPVQSVATRTGAVTLAHGDISGLGTAAVLDTGTTANKVVALDGSAKLPAIDGSQLTNLPGGGAVTSVAGRTGVVTLGRPDIAIDVNAQTVQAYTILASDAGKLITFDYASDVHVNVTNTLGVGFTCDILQIGAGQVQLSGAGTAIYGGTAGNDVNTLGVNSLITVTCPSSTAAFFVTGQVGPTLTATYREFTNLGGSDLYFDDYMGAVGSGSTPSWGSSAYLQIPYADLAGKWKKYDIADYGTLKTDVQTALSASGWMANSMAYAGDLAVVGNAAVENSTTGPLYAWASTGGTSLTAMQDASSSVNFVPIIYGTDYGNNTGYGPTWGLTIVYDEMGAVEETYDASGVNNNSSGTIYAAYMYGNTAGDAFSGWTMNGNDGTVGAPMAANAATGDQS